MLSVSSSSMSTENIVYSHVVRPIIRTVDHVGNGDARLVIHVVVMWRDERNRLRGIPIVRDEREPRWTPPVDSPSPSTWLGGPLPDLS